MEAVEAHARAASQLSHESITGQGDGDHGSSQLFEAVGKHARKENPSNSNSNEDRWSQHSSLLPDERE